MSKIQYLSKNVFAIKVCVDGEFVGYALTDSAAEKMIGQRAYDIAVRYNVGDQDCQTEACFEYEAFLNSTGTKTHVTVSESDWKAYLEGND